MEAEFLQLAQEARVNVAEVWALVGVAVFLVVMGVLHLLGYTENGELGAD